MVKKLVIEVSDPNLVPLLRVDLPLQLTAEMAGKIELGFFKVRIKLVEESDSAFLETR